MHSGITYFDRYGQYKRPVYTDAHIRMIVGHTKHVDL